MKRSLLSRHQGRKSASPSRRIFSTRQSGRDWKLKQMPIFRQILQSYALLRRKHFQRIIRRRAGRSSKCDEETLETWNHPQVRRPFSSKPDASWWTGESSADAQAVLIRSSPPVPAPGIIRRRTGRSDAWRMENEVKNGVRNHPKVNKAFSQNVSQNQMHKRQNC